MKSRAFHFVILSFQKMGVKHIDTDYFGNAWTNGYQYY